MPCLNRKKSRRPKPILSPKIKLKFPKKRSKDQKKVKKLLG